VIGRDTATSFSGATDWARYAPILRQHFAVDEVLTYDDLVKKARAALFQLQSLADAVINQ
jgi:hypothetical protein